MATCVIAFLIEALVIRVIINIIGVVLETACIGFNSEYVQYIDNDVTLNESRAYRTNHPQRATRRNSRRISIGLHANNTL